MSKGFEFTAKVTGEIVQIPIERLFSHPNNVRDDVGDISELTESIKAKGILQNLSVVPDADCKGYLVVIGNRRLAAARAAGLETLPCVIADMTRQEQIETMLLENIQRTDLTPYEQARGFQLMIDFGDTVAEVSQKTGFAETTVRRRLEIAKLDPKKLKETEGRQVSISDLDRLSQIDDVKERNKLLEVIGTSDYNNRVRWALERQNAKNNLPLVKQAIKELGAKPMKADERYSRKYECVTGWVRLADWDEKKRFGVKIKAGEELFYFLDDTHVDLYRKRPKAAPEKRSKKEIQKEEAAREVFRRLQEMTRRHRQLRRDFESGLKMTAGNREKWLTWCVRLMALEITSYYSHSTTRETVEKILNVDTESYKKGTGIYIEPAKRRKAVFDAAVADRENMVKTVVAFLDDCDSREYYYSADFRLKSGIKPSYSPDDRLDLIYEFLCDFGYEMSDEEKKMRAGDPELFGETK